ncbi:MAG: riboflavin kinase [Erysipelotrichia bacterium]|nr:riboflavin kinase [Erysipelotrichia bacterium]
MDIIESKVIHGKGKGKSMGFATANQDISNLKVYPKNGVYASLVWIDKQKYIGITNVGTRPTVDNDKDITIETHILHYDKDLYGKTIKVELYYYLRDIKKFVNKKELLQQIEQDSLEAEQLFKEKDQ